MPTQLTAAQVLALKNHIATNPATVLINGAPVAISAVPVSPDNAQQVAGWYNLAAEPAWTVWRTAITVKEVKQAIVWTEYIASVTQADHNAFSLIISNGIVNGADVNVRQGFADIFTGPQKAGTRNALLTLAKRAASNAEKLFSTGTGSVATPATTDANVGESFRLTGGDVLEAWK